MDIHRRKSKQRAIYKAFGFNDLFKKTLKKFNDL